MVDLVDLADPEEVLLVDIHTHTVHDVTVDILAVPVENNLEVAHTSLGEDMGNVKSSHAEQEVLVALEGLQDSPLAEGLDIVQEEVIPAFVLSSVNGHPWQRKCAVFVHKVRRAKGIGESKYLRQS